MQINLTGRHVEITEALKLNKSVKVDSDMIIQIMNKIKELVDANTEINNKAMRIINKKK